MPANTTDITINDFKGVFKKASPFSLPTVLADTCTDFSITYSGQLKKRGGSVVATLLGDTFNTNITGGGTLGNIIAFFELVTGQSSRPTEYFVMTSATPGKIYKWDETGAGTWTQYDNSLTDFRNSASVVQPCLFMNDNGNLRILAGNRSGNYSLFWGYVQEKFTHAISANAGTKTPISAEWLDNCVLADIGQPNASNYFADTAAALYDKVNINLQGAGVTWSSAMHVHPTVEGVINTHTYWYRLSLQYDNKQWSVPSEPHKELSAFVTSTALSSLTFRTNFVFSIDGTSLDGSDQLSRLSGFRVFRHEAGMEGYTKYDGPYYLIEDVQFSFYYGSFDEPTNQIWPIVDTNGYKTATFTTATDKFALKFGGALPATITDDDALWNDMFNGGLLLVRQTGTSTVRTCRITDTVFTSTSDMHFIVDSDSDLIDSTDYDIKVVSGWVKNSNNYEYLIVDMIDQSVVIQAPTMRDSLGISKNSATGVNAKYATDLQGQTFYANCYHDGETKEHIIAYGQFTEGGLFANDTHPILNAFTFGKSIKGVSSIGDRLILYGTQEIQRGIIPSGNELSWEFEKMFFGFGLLASTALVTIGGRDYFLATDWNIYEFDGVARPRIISEGVHEALQTAGNTSITYLQNVILFYMPNQNMLGMKLQTGSGTFVYWGYDLNHKNGWIKNVWASELTDYNGFVVTQNGVLLGFTDSSIHELNTDDTTDVGGYINPQYKSVPLWLDKKARHHLSQIIFTYASNTTLSGKLYLDSSASAATTVTLAAQTTAKSVAYNLPLGMNCRHFQFELTIPAANLATNTQLELHEVQIPARLSGAEV